jgi:hypothetical protein
VELGTSSACRYDIIIDGESDIVPQFHNSFKSPEVPVRFLPVLVSTYCDASRSVIIGIYKKIEC